MVVSTLYLMLHNIPYIVLCVLCDAVLFFCLDKASGVFISQCRSLQEKRNIWIFESLALFALSFLVLIYHHTPFFLWTLAAMTFASGTLTGHVDFLSYWNTLSTYWYEFKDQEEVFTPAALAEPVYTNKNPAGQYPPPHSQRADAVVINNQNNIDTSAVDQNLKSLRYNPQTLTFEYVGSQPQRGTSSARGRPSNPADGNPTAAAALRRRALHLSSTAGDVVTSVAPDDRPEAGGPSVLGSLESLGTRVWSVLRGSGRAGGPVAPPGLRNGGKNLCFMNSVLQCVGRTPNFADELADHSKCCQTEDKMKQLLVDSAASVLQELIQPPGVGCPALVETADLIRAGSHLNPDLLNDYQSQQDACEFLTWLLQELHEIINEDRRDRKGRMRADDSMNKLKTVYGNISEQYIKVMIAECKKQISAGSALNDPELAEPIQNLSNMEWLSHKRANSSVIDDLFTFQCVELRTCSRCRHSTANVQAMNVLSLPVPSQAESSTIHDCLGLFTRQEKLQGRDGLHCESCQAVGASPARATAPSTPSCISPIASDGRARRSATASRNFLSSTPLPGSARTSSADSGPLERPRAVSEGVRQSFLRHLQECVVIQLLRFCYNPFTKKVTKTHTPVTVAVDLDLSPYVFDSTVAREDVMYAKEDSQHTLYAMCMHIGGERTSAGHYLCYCKAADGRWYRFDDESVLLVEDFEREREKAVVKENCYLLFYRKNYLQNGTDD